jgi:hypothetical protein
MKAALTWGGIGAGIIGSAVVAHEISRRITESAYHLDARGGSSQVVAEWTDPNGAHMQAEQFLPPFGSLTRDFFWLGPAVGAAALTVPSLGIGAWVKHDAVRFGALLIAGASVGLASGATWAWINTNGTSIHEVPGPLDPKDMIAPERPTGNELREVPAHAEPPATPAKPAGERVDTKPVDTAPINTSGDEDVDPSEQEIDEDGFDGQP